MSKSPLDGSFSSRNKSKKIKLFSIAGFGVALIAGAGVFAANIAIATGAIEFGQGVASATACDNTITVVPNSTFDGAQFMVSSVELRGVDSSNSGCNGKTLTIKAISSSATLGTVSTVVPSGAASVDITVVPTPTVTASVLTKILLESN
ncbi:MAG: hypothetical protein RLZZ37_334 [Actinomycetota bacterium]|jgi:hypothetical protein